MPINSHAALGSEQKFNWRVFYITLLTFLGLLLLSLLPHWSKFGFCPNFLSMLLYLWILYRPDLISTRLIVIIGLLRDSLFAYPLGISVIELIILQTITQMLRWWIVGYSFWVNYMGYALFICTSQAFLWFLLSLTKNNWLPFTGAAKAILFNILIFPVFNMVSMYLQQRIDREQQG